MKAQKGFTLIEMLFVAGGVAAIALGGTVLYVAGHFIAKFW